MRAGWLMKRSFARKSQESQQGRGRDHRHEAVAVSGSTIATVLSGPPQVTGFTPSSGPVGTHVTIQGTNLLETTSVDFGGVATQFTVNSSSSVTATVLARARTAAITVTSPLGTGKRARTSSQSAERHEEVRDACICRSRRCGEQ
jgi:hypothetical protein